MVIEVSDIPYNACYPLKIRLSFSYEGVRVHSAHMYLAGENEIAQDKLGV